MRKVPSPGRHSGTSASLSKRTVALSSSTKSATCRSRCRPSCCECWKRASWSASAATNPFASTARVLVAHPSRPRPTRGTRQLSAGLYHRVVVFPITLPPLRERAADIPMLVEHFAAQVCAQNGWKAIPFSASAIEKLVNYSWPGNVRELRNIVERLLLLATGGEVNGETVDLALPRSAKAFQQSAATVRTGPLAEQVTSFEREAILTELQRQHYHITNAAKALGLERSHLYKKCQQLGIPLRAGRNAVDSSSS